MDIIQASYYIDFALYRLSGVTNTPMSPWRSHAGMFTARSTQPNITVQHIRSGNTLGWQVGDFTLIELCDSKVQWPPTETCIYDPSSPERILNGNFQYFDVHYPSQISYWDIEAPGRADNIVVLPISSNQDIDDSNTAGVGLHGLRPTMSQTLYGLDTAKEYEFGVSISWSSGFGLGTASAGCNFTAALGEEVFWKYDGTAATATWVRYSARVQPSAPMQKLMIGSQCAADTGLILKEGINVKTQYLRLDDVSFQEHIK